jgi:hypothetical protein
MPQNQSKSLAAWQLHRHHALPGRPWQAWGAQMLHRRCLRTAGGPSVCAKTAMKGQGFQHGDHTAVSRWQAKAGKTEGQPFCTLHTPRRAVERQDVQRTDITIAQRCQKLLQQHPERGCVDRPTGAAEQSRRSAVHLRHVRNAHVHGLDTGGKGRSAHHCFASIAANMSLQSVVS